MEEKEIWKDVVGWEGFYKVSSLGRVKSLERVVKRGDNMLPIKGRFLKILLDRKGYCFVHLCDKEHGMEVIERVHQLVAKAFIPNTENKMCVDHINDNPKDNRACNLQWCTPKMNSSKESHRKAVSVGLLGHVASNRTPVACLTLDGNLVKTYPSMKHAELEGYSHSAIYSVANNKRKSHGGYKWMYLSEYEKLSSVQ